MYFLLLENNKLAFLLHFPRVCCRLEALLITRKLCKDLVRVDINQCQYPVSSIDFLNGYWTATEVDNSAEESHF
jgi:hypothetical protein